MDIDAATRRLPEFIKTLRINRAARRESVYAADNVYALLDACDAAEARVRELEAWRDKAIVVLKWTDEVYLARIEAGGAGVEITWDEFNAMREVAGFKPVKRINDKEGRAGFNHRLRARLSTIEAETIERCAELADCYADECDAASFSSTVADQVSALRSKEQAAREIAAAIRQLAKEVKP